MTGASSPAAWPRRCASIAAPVLAYLWLGACGGGGGSTGGTGGAPAESVPQPDLAAVEPAVRRVIEEARRRVETDVRSAEAWAAYGAVLGAHDYAQASIDSFQHAAALEPLVPLWHYLAGSSLLRTHPLEAAESLRRAAELAPGEVRYRSRLGDALLWAGHDAEAQAEFNAALALDPAWRPALVGLGIITLQRGEARGAVRLLEAAADQDFFDREVHAALARALTRLGEPERAAREAILAAAYTDSTDAADPYSARIASAQAGSVALIARGAALAATGQLPQSEQCFRDAIAQQPGIAHYHSNLATVLARQGRPDEAQTALEKAQQLAPRDPAVMNAMGVVLMARGRFDVAADWFRRSCELDSSDAESHQLLGNALLSLGAYEQAEASLRRALDRAPTLSPAHRELGNLLHRDGREEEAMHHWREAVELGRGDPAAAALFADAARTAGRAAEAARILRLSLSARPDSPPVLARLVNLLATARDDGVRDGPEAVRLATRLVELAGRSEAYAHELLAAALAEAGRRDEAIIAADRALAIVRSTGKTDLLSQVETTARMIRAGQPIRH